jgi:hypothetical protein
MPDLNAILSFYRRHAAASASGLPGLVAAADMRDASRELERVAFSFLLRDEGQDWHALEERVRATRLRMGRQRFRRWEIANPDICALLRRKARG